MREGSAKRIDDETATHESGELSPSPYERVIGRYALCPAFARGGMATVHLARQVSDEGFSRVVAVKRLHAHVAESNESLAMFLDEARLASRIRHSNVVPTLDVVSRDGELLIVMEYVLGDSLSGLIRAAVSRGQRVPIPVAVRIAIDMLHGLHAAHEAKDEDGQPLGIVHRDVSPQNVLVGVDGVPRIVDFGIAKAAGRLQTTQNNKLKGKLAYMAPEQLERKDALDRRVDVYAVSIVLWEMLTMTRLFRGEDEIDTFKQALSKEIPAPRSLNEEVSEQLQTVVMHGLNRDRNARPESARALAAELEELRLACTGTALADWVTTTADASLEQARTRFAALEQAPPPEDLAELGSRPSWSDGSVRAMLQHASAKQEEATDVMGAGAGAEAETGSPITVTGVERPERSKRSLWLVVAAVALLIVGIGIGFGGSSTEPESPVAAQEAPDGMRSPQLPELPQEKGAAQAESEPAAEDKGEPTTDSEPEPEPEQKDEPEGEMEEMSPPPSKAPQRPIVRPTPRPKTKPKDDCSNPFTVDKDGVKVPKVHCL